ncbi:hypothetical protein [Actinomadura parmotrematis]|uniref:Uncharacterized protein n=1 Tax=Actinomadura parmotrematis TaxID=2864039 RepID=A0ABS7FWY3_9ACTN|nr:hypothetical protein [Actinomadura parmotrematis]MBW8484942.1 hypothetical protein [Actinomadura parmotrematis]
MVRLLSGWAAALVVWLVGFTVVSQLAGGAEGPATLSAFDRLVRLDVPWILISALMVIVTGAFCRDRTRLARWLPSLLLMPALAILAGLAGVAAGAVDPAAGALSAAEGVGGAAIGLLVAARIAEREKEGGGYW